jgi:hypothetical protein
MDEKSKSALNPWWIAGFVDGEGCFSISFVKNDTVRFGYQIFTEFVITQGEKSKKALEDIREYFGCGKLYVNRRTDNHNEPLYRYCVRSRGDLQNIIIPFFKEHRLQTAKNNDFEIFAWVVAMMSEGIHLEEEGFESIKELTAQTNRRKRRIMT